MGKVKTKVKLYQNKGKYTNIIGRINSEDCRWEGPRDAGPLLPVIGGRLCPQLVGKPPELVLEVPSGYLDEPVFYDGMALIVKFDLDDQQFPLVWGTVWTHTAAVQLDALGCGEAYPTLACREDPVAVLGEAEVGRPSVRSRLPFYPTVPYHCDLFQRNNSWGLICALPRTKSITSGTG